MDPCSLPHSASLETLPDFLQACSHGSLHHPTDGPPNNGGLTGFLCSVNKGHGALVGPDGWGGRGAHNVEVVGGRYVAIHLRCRFRRYVAVATTCCTAA